MGVQSLFTLLEVTGTRRNIEAVSGQRVAVDASVWLGQILKAMRDERGEVISNAHLYGFFTRICRLLFNRIRPVFVFDGSTPALKRQTTASRRRKRENSASRTQKIAQRLFATQLRQRELAHAASSLSSPQNSQPQAASSGVTQQQREQQQQQQTQRNADAHTEEEEVDLRPEYGEDEEEEDEGLDLDQLASSGTELDPEVLQSLPPSTALQLVEKMRDHNFGVTRQKLQRLSDAPLSFSSQQIQAYLQGTKAKKTWNDALKKIGTNSEDADTNDAAELPESDSVRSQMQRIQADSNREYYFATSDEALLNQDTAGAAPSEVKQLQQRGKKRSRKESTLDLLPSEPVDDLKLKSATLHPKLPKPLQGRVLEETQKMQDPGATASEASIHKKPGNTGTGGEEDGVHVTFTLPTSEAVPAESTRNDAAKQGDYQDANYSETAGTKTAAIGAEDDEEDEWEDIPQPAPVSSRSTIEASKPVHKKEVYSRSHGFLFGRSLAQWGEQQEQAAQGENAGKMSNENEQQPIARDSGLAKSSGAIGSATAGEHLMGSDCAIQSLLKGKLRECLISQLQLRDFVTVDETVDSLNAQASGMDETEELSKEEALEMLHTILEEEADVFGYSSEDELLWWKNSKSELSANVPFGRGADHVIKRQAETTENLSLPHSTRADHSSKAPSTAETAQQEEVSQNSEDATADTDKVYRETRPTLAKRAAERLNTSSTQRLPHACNYCGPASNAHERREQKDEQVSQHETSAHLPYSLEANHSNELQIRHDDEESGHAQFPQVSMTADIDHEQSPHSNEKEKQQLQDSEANPREANHNWTNVHPPVDQSNDNAALNTMHNQSGSSLDSNESRKDDDGRAEDDKTKPNSSADIVTETHRSEQDMQQEMDHLEEERKRMEQQIKKQARYAEEPTEEMYAECQELLQMFGIPYIIAPEEAEAQCAYLEQEGLVDSVVTDDSDVFLFGARKVYRHMFDQRNYMEEYNMDTMEHELNIGREQLALLALALGSDYTEGIQGVGVVNALELISAFRSLQDLRAFKKWFDTPASEVLLGSDETVEAAKAQYGFDDKQVEFLRSSAKRIKKFWVPPEGFPNQRVVDAYLKPTVDRSKEDFEWGKPDLDLLRLFCREKFGWENERTERTLQDVLKHWEEQKRQRLMTEYIQASYQQRFAKIGSKRLKRALESVNAAKAQEVSITRNSNNATQAQTQRRYGSTSKSQSQKQEDKRRMSTGRADKEARDSAAGAQTQSSERQEDEQQVILDDKQEPYVDVQEHGSVCKQPVSQRIEELHTRLEDDAHVNGAERARMQQELQQLQAWCTNNRSSDIIHQQSSHEHGKDESHHQHERTTNTIGNSGSQKQKQVLDDDESEENE